MSLLLSVADARRIPLPDESVHACICSPPYWGLRRYDVPGEIGLEASPDEYVAQLVAVFREIWRVLRADGTVWLNLGDSYGHGTSARRQPGDAGLGNKTASARGIERHGEMAKQLMMIPARVALALQADGWWLRSDVIWHKPNVMPESVTDRPTTAHEHVFLLTKSKTYFYDAAAVREAHKPESLKRVSSPLNTDRQRDFPGSAQTLRMGEGQQMCHPAGRNKRSVWTITTQAYKGAHFATFPPALVEPMVLAGTSAKGCCPECGAPWRRVLEKGLTAHDGETQSNYPTGSTANRLALLRQAARERGEEYVNTNRTIGWRPTCACGCPEGIQPDDFEYINTPTGTRVGDDPSLRTGRAGYNRPRGDNEGTCPITRYEQRQYAMQLRQSAHRSEMEVEAGPAFAHYIRTDKSGARPVPNSLLSKWLEQGWLAKVIMPEWMPPEPVPAIVLDVFGGTMTVGQVCAKHGRRFVGLDLKREYVEMGKQRCASVQTAMPL